jgi:hypothetical protein
MGKVVRTVGAIALAVAVSALAPGLGLTISFVLNSSLAVGTAIAAVGLSLAAGALMQAIGSNPSLTPTQERGPIMVQENWRWKPVARPEPESLPFGPIPLRLRRSPVLALMTWLATWYYGPRYYLVRNVGECMEPSLPRGWWVLMDSRRAAQPGDAVSFMTDDLFINWIDDLSPLQRALATGMIKEFVGMADGGQVMVFRTRNDPVTGHTGVSRILYLHVVVSTHRHWWQAMAALLRQSVGGDHG